MILASVIISVVTILVMAEEFNQLPKSLQNFSSMLVHNRNIRNLFICGVIIIMSTSISLSLLELNEFELPENNATKSYDIKTSYLKSNQPIIISNLNIYENGFPSYYEPKYDNQNNSIDRNKQEIILNLFLTATIHHNITLNGIQIDDMLAKNCETDCDEQRIKDIVRTYIDTIKMTNNSINEVEDSEKLSNSSTNNEFNSSVKPDDYKEHKIEKRSVLPKNSNNESNINTKNTIQDEDCRHPEYVVFMWVLCLIALATALKLYYLIKTVLAVAMVVVFSILILNTNVFNKEAISMDSSK